MPILRIGKKKKSEKKRMVGGPVGTVASRQASVGVLAVHPAQVEEEERKARQAQASGSEGSEEKVTVDVPVLCRAEAICAYEPDDFEVDADITFLRFETGQQIDVIEQDESGWWEGIIEGIAGIFPGAYVRVVEIYGAEEGVEPPKASATLPCDTVDLNNASSTDADPELHEKKLHSTASRPAAPEETLEDAELALLAAAGAFAASSREASEDLPGLEDVLVEAAAASEDSDPLEPQHPAPDPPLSEGKPAPRSVGFAPASHSTGSATGDSGGAGVADDAREASASFSGHSGATTAASVHTERERELNQHISVLTGKVEKQAQAIKQLMARAEAAERDARTLRSTLGKVESELEASKTSIVAARSMQEKHAAATSELQKLRGAHAQSEQTARSMQEKHTAATVQLEQLRSAHAQSEQARAEADAYAEELLTSLNQERAAIAEMRHVLQQTQPQPQPATEACDEELQQARAVAAAAQRELAATKAEFEGRRSALEQGLGEIQKHVTQLSNEADSAKQALVVERLMRKEAERLAEERGNAVAALEEAAAARACETASPPAAPSPQGTPAAALVPGRAAPRTIKVVRGRVLRRAAPARGQGSVPQAIASRPLPPPPQ